MLGAKARFYYKKLSMGNQHTNFLKIFAFYLEEHPKCFILLKIYT